MKAFDPDVVVVSLFLAVVVGVYFWCFQILKAGKQHRYRFKAFEYPVLLSGLLGILCFVYGVVEPFRLETTTVSLKSDKIKSPFRIVHITDLHCDGMVRTEDRLPALVASVHPDLIAFTGDAANSEKGLKDFQECIHKLATIAPIYGVYGNHDSRSGRKRIFADESDMIRLDCTARQIKIDGDPIWIGGVGVDNEQNSGQLLAQRPAKAFTILLYHYPVGIQAASANSVDLFLAGHTHGGQVRLPFYGALVTNSPLGKKYEYGMYKVANTHMFISRGIGMVGLPVRFLAPPEVAVIDVLPNEDIHGEVSFVDLP